ncbi:uncharacterized protein [Dermacentor andersoni]|uniref:uncharacterized protein n=1 Tax=Dermacentor andersoni TaxID=34620 RepID=UPI003B3B0EC0
MTEVFLLYRLSSCWSSFIAMLTTVSLSLALSLFLGSREDLRRSLRFSSPTFLSLWARLGLLHGDMEEHNDEGDTKADEECAEVQLATMVPVAKVTHDDPFYVGANDLLS